MSAILGTDCHLTLAHPQIDSGAPYGFILEAQDDFGALIQMQREAYSDALGEPVDVQHFFFNVLLADHCLNPDGSRRSGTRAADYAKLISILALHSQISIGTPLGLFFDYYAIQQITLEKQYSDHDLITVHLSSHSTAFLPADPLRYANSLWVDETAYSGAMNWGNSYWSIRP